MRISATTSGTDSMPPLISSLIERIKNAGSQHQFVEELNNARSLQTILAKTELYRWMDVLNRCDDILEDAVVVENGRMKVDSCLAVKSTCVAVLRFTALLFECSSTRRVYASTERLLELLKSEDLTVVAEVLRLLQTISKRSKFLTQRLNGDDQTALVHHLTAIAQCWGGRLRNLKMIDCLDPDAAITVFPFVYSDGKGNSINLESISNTSEPLRLLVDRYCHEMDKEHQYCVLARLRMLRFFHLHEHRMQCLIVRLLSVSTLIHCRCQPDETQINALLYSGFIEETAAVLKVELTRHPLIDPIQTEALRTLTSIVSLEKAPKIQYILESLSADTYHGFLAAFTRMVVDELKKNDLGSPGKPSVALGTALFSFIYHISSVEPGGDTLVTSGLTQTLLGVLEHKNLALEQISFATRCSRIIDIFTTIDVTAFNASFGMSVFVDRLVHEINECRKEQPFVIDISGDVDDDSFKNTPVKCPTLDKRCHQHRSGLIKGLITFIKRAIQETQLQDSIRHLMDGGLPEALIHIISNAEFYSDSIYHHSLQLITNFIYQEPTQLTLLQQKHVPFVMLQSMLRKELPNSRDVISNLGNVFTALCLNEQGLRQFKSYRPFDHVFKVVLSIKFIATMKKKRSEMSDAAQGIGSALDDLLRHQPTLKPLMMESILMWLDTLLNIGQNPPPNTKIVMALSRSASKAACQNFGGGSGGNSPGTDQIPEEEEMVFSPLAEELSDEDEEAELSMDDMSSVHPEAEDKMGLEMHCPSETGDGPRLLPLGDYLLIFTKIFETIITQVAAQDMVEGFVDKDGIEKLLSVGQLPALSTELAGSYIGQSIANIVQYVLQNGRASERLMSTMLRLFSQRAAPLVEQSPDSGGSFFAHLNPSVLYDALSCLNLTIPILSHLSKPGFGGGQYSSDRRTRVHEAWLTDSGKALHCKLRMASRHLSWEATLIRLIEPSKAVASTQTDTLELSAIDDASIMERSTPEPNNVASVAIDPAVRVSEQSSWEQAGITQLEVDFWRGIKPAADQLMKCNKNVSDLLNLLARSCYIPSRRNRRYDFSSTPMPKSAVKMADLIFSGFYRDLKWSAHKCADSTMEYGRLCELLSQMSLVLFDERRQAYHAMLEKFYTSGCHQAFCEVLSKKLAPALGGHTLLPLEMAFMEWFRLAERLANKHNMTYTMYRQNQLQTQQFDPEKYSKLVHTDFFRCLSTLFARLSGEGVDLKEHQALCESAISVYKEVAQNMVTTTEDIVSDRGASNVPQLDAPDQPAQEENIRQLCELGFDRNEAVDALAQNRTVNEAAEWLMGRQAIVDNPADLLMRQHIFVEVGAGNPDDDIDSEASERVSAVQEDTLQSDDSVTTPIITPLRELRIEDDVSVSQACIELMPLCKRLMEVGSDLVFSCAELVIGVVDSLDESWKHTQLINSIMIEEVINMARIVIATPDEKSVSVLATRIHFVCLLFEHVSDDYLTRVALQPMVSTLLMLLGVVYDNFEVPHMHSTLLPPVVLWLDLYDKCSRSLKRRKLLKDVVPSEQLNWTYIGDDGESRYSAPRNGKKWVPYTAPVQLQINKAFFRGKESVTIKKKDKELLIDFTQMKQKENDVMKGDVNVELPDSSNIECADIELVERQSVWSPAERSDLLVQISRLFHKGVVQHTAAHSLLSFTVRLTRDPQCAMNFLQQGGVAAILQLRSSQSPCTIAMVSLILRQCIDTDDILKSVCEKAVKHLSSMHTTPLNEYLGVADNKPKEWFDILKKLTPLAVRIPDVFSTIMARSTKISSNGMNVEYVGKSPKTGTDTNTNMEQIVDLLLKEVLQGEWPPLAALGCNRMLTRGSILTLLAELAKTYGGAANLVCDAKHDGQSVVQLLLEKYLDGNDSDTMKSIKVLISVIAGCNHSPKAQESLVGDVKAALISTGSTVASSTIGTKIDELCSLMIMMVDSCPSAIGNTPQRATIAPNPIMKLFQKKKICNDLVKTITCLQLSQKESIDTVNQVLKTLETMMRHINGPTSQSGRANVDLRMEQILNSSVMRSLLPAGVMDDDDDDDERSRLSARFMIGADRLFRAHMDSRAAENAAAIEHRDAEEHMEIVARRVREEAEEHAPVAEEDGEEHHEDDEEDGEDEEDSQSSEEEADGDDEEIDEDIPEEQMMDGGPDHEIQQEAAQGGSIGEGNNDETMDLVNREEDDDGNDAGDGDTEDDEEDEGDEDEYDDFYDDAQDIPQAIYHDFDRPRPNIMLDGFVDEWDLFPPPFALRNEPRRRQGGPDSQHPLLVRPQHLSDQIPAPGAVAASALARDYRLGLTTGPLSLSRQNAIRRMGTTGRPRAHATPTSQIFDRLFDIQFRDRSIMGPNYDRERSDRQMRSPVSVPSALDRLTEGADLLDPLSIRFVAILLNTIVTRNAKKNLEDESKKEKDAKEKLTSEQHGNGVADGGAGGSSTFEAETATVITPPETGVAEPIVDAPTQGESPDSLGDSARMEVASPELSSNIVGQLDLDTTQEDEQMEVTDYAGVVAPTTDDVATGVVTTSTGAAEEPMEDSESSPPAPSTQPSGNMEDVVVATVDSTMGGNVPEEYRDILGDITIPDGVDPAFLAALPDDMRAEVIRDHERQQRAQRITATASNLVMPAPIEGTAPAVVVPIVEPIDQEFLAALPPELQEEIIQQHERAVREAEEAVRRAAAPAVPVADPEMDGAAVIASLPPTERQQVLAEMDDAELQRLPQAMQDEARRARNNLHALFEPHIHRNVMRIHNLYVRGGPGGRAMAIRTTGTPRLPSLTVGNLAGKMNTASAQATQLLDKEAILTLCGLFLMDNRLSIQRLQKVIRAVCSHGSSCDFVIWCLQALLEKACEATVDEDEIVSLCPAWLESITVPGVGQNERSVKISKNGSNVFLHPLVANSVCRGVMDTLTSLAKSYPGHFVPSALRSTTDLESKEQNSLESFWKMIQNPSGKGASNKEAVLDCRSPADQLKTSSLACLMQMFSKPAIKGTNTLIDKLLKLISTIVQTLPNDTMIRLGLKDDSLPLRDELETIINILTSGSCTQDGYVEARTLLVEIMRAFSPATSEIIYDTFCTSIQNVGLLLKPQIERLLSELESVTESSASASAPINDKSRITSARLAGDAVVVDGEAMGRLKMTASSCLELKLPAVMALTDRSGAQFNLMRSLHTLTKLRDTMRIMKEEHRKRREDEEKKKKEEVEKAAAAAASVAAAATAATSTSTTGAETSEKVAESNELTTTNNSTEAPIDNTSRAMDTTEPQTSSDEVLPGNTSSPSITESSALPIEEPLETLRSIEKLDSRLSQRLTGLDDLWSMLSACLLRLGKASDPHAVLILQPAAESFFLVHAVSKSVVDNDQPDTVKLIEFAEKHRQVLNQVLRQNTYGLGSGGPFSVLTLFPKLLDFDVKRKHFRKELLKIDVEREMRYRRADVNVQVRRSQLFSDSFRELFRLKPAEWKKRFYIVFQGEEGQDAGGLLREWFSVITREIFNPNYALFITAPGDMVTYMINKASYINPEHLDYFKFVGRLIAKAIYDGKLLDCYFTRAFYKHILNIPVRYQDIESEDPGFFKSLEFLLNNPINDLGLDLSFSLEVEEFGVRSIRDLKPDGRKIDVTDENKTEYVNLVCQMKMTGSIRKQLDAFLTGFYEVIPRQLISMFNEQELELLISGLPEVDIDDLANNTEYKSYTKTSPQIQWFWRALRSFESEDRAKFLQFVTGTSKVPLQGFSTLEGMNGVQKFSVHMDSRGGDRLPAAHTCFNQLDLPQYESYEKLRDRLLVAIRECTEGFGFA